MKSLMDTKVIKKYQPKPVCELTDRQWPNQTLSQSPIWCSVDLRDGNQALPQPMTVQEKLEFFQVLVAIGFKEIEVGFPSASQTEFDFLRKLIENNLIPDDVSIQVLVQARTHLIDRTIESLRGAKQAIIHLYNSTSPLQRDITFNRASRETIRDLAVEHTHYIKSKRQEIPETQITLQYSPESFSDTELDFALEICESVMDAWQPSTDNKIILNLPATVEWTTPNVYADQIEWFARHLKNRDQALMSLHTHNDRGTGIAATELSLLAGADRVEGTLFGNGERTGNLDITIVAINLNSHGIETGLDFSDLPKLCEVYQKLTRMGIHKRHPYAGELVFSAFSGSHQDAIKKGFSRRQQDCDDKNLPWESTKLPWRVPYLTIDPLDVNREYTSVVRINSQSGKGGVAFVLEQEFGFDLPKEMHNEVGSHIYQVADKQSKELTDAEVMQLFQEAFINLTSPLELLAHNCEQLGEAKYEFLGTLLFNDKSFKLNSILGNGPIDALTSAIMTNQYWESPAFDICDYRAHAIAKKKQGSQAQSAAYVQVVSKATQKRYWGCGVDNSIQTAGLLALISAWNRMKLA